MKYTNQFEKQFCKNCGFNACKEDDLNLCDSKTGKNPKYFFNKKIKVGTV